MNTTINNINIYNHYLQNVYVNINRILAVATRMIEGGHYAAAHIRTVANRLDRTWKEFAAGLDERTAVLALSVLFHHKAEQVNLILVLSSPVVKENISNFQL